MTEKMMYKCFRAEVKSVDKDTGEVEMMIPVSTMSIDRDGEVVEPTAFKKTLPVFMKRPVLIASHDYRDLTNQIGEWKKLKIEETGMLGRPKYYINEGNEQADWGFNLASKGMAAFSIGFIPKVWEDGDGQKTPRRTYKEVELLEISQVVVPSNRDAIQGIRSKGVDPVVEELLEEVEAEIDKIPAAASAAGKEAEEFVTRQPVAVRKPDAPDAVVDQNHISDELDYALSLVKAGNFNEKNLALLKELCDEIMRFTGGDTPAENKVPTAITAVKVAPDDTEVIDRIVKATVSKVIEKY